MGHVTISINGKQYNVACQDGEEARLYQLATVLEHHIQTTKAAFPHLGDMRLLILVALTLADQLYDAKTEREGRPTTTTPQQSPPAGPQTAPALRAHLETIRERLKTLASQKHPPTPEEEIKI